MEIANELRAKMLGFPPPGNARLNEIAKIEDEEERYNALNEYKEEIRLATLQRTSEYFAKNHVLKSAFALKYGISESMAHRIAKGERAIPVDILVQVCYQEMSMSCGDLIFGEKPKIIIPNEISTVFSLVNEHAKLKPIVTAYGKSVVVHGYQKSDSSLLISRINERVEQVGLVIREQMAYYPWYSALYKRLRFSAKENEKLPGHLSSLLVTAWSVGMPVDYLLAKDYTLFSDLYYRKGNKLEKVPKSLSPLVSVFLRLDDEVRNEMICECLKLA